MGLFGLGEKKQEEPATQETEVKDETSTGREPELKADAEADAKVSDAMASERIASEAIPEPPVPEGTKEARCLKCKKKVPMVNPEEVILKSNRRALKAICGTCGTKLFRITGKV